MPRPSHSSRFITRTLLGEECRSLSSSLYSFLHSPVTSSLFGPNIVAAVTKAVPIERQEPSFTVQQCCGHPLSFHIASFSFLYFSLCSSILPTLASFLSTSLSLFVPSVTCLSLVAFPLPFRFIFYLALLHFSIPASPFFPYFLPLLLHVRISDLASTVSTYRSLLPCIFLHFFLIHAPTVT